MKAGRLDDAAGDATDREFHAQDVSITRTGDPEHHLTQGFVVGGSTPEGRDQTNRLSWLLLEAATNMALPEPLIWVRWHPAVDQKFFDFCLTRAAAHHLFPDALERQGRDRRA